MAEKTSVTLRVNTMTCQACVRSVTEAVNDLGADVVTVVDLSKKEVRVTGTASTL